MKAIIFDRFGGPDVLRLVDMPRPVPGAGEALIRVEAAGTGHGDCKLRQGALKQYFEVRLPKIPGRDGIGRIVELADPKSSHSIGDRVCFLTPMSDQGSCAEYIVRPAASIVAVPIELSLEEAMGVAQPGCCAWISIVDTAQLRRGERIMVHGAAGAIGSIVVQLAKHIGATVTAVCRSRDRGLVESLGADTVLCFDEMDVFASSERFDVVFDPLGGEVHSRSYEVLKPRGRLVYLVADPIIDRSSQFGVTLVRAMIEDNLKTLTSVLALAAEGLIRPITPRQFPLEKCADAHRLLESGAKGPGRVILTMNNTG